MAYFKRAEFWHRTPCRITYSGGERVPQHELLACAQCGCFAFSCFEDFAIRAKTVSGKPGAVQSSFFRSVDLSIIKFTEGTAGPVSS